MKHKNPMKKITINKTIYYFNKKTESLFFDKNGQNCVALARFNNQEYTQFLEQIRP